MKFSFICKTICIASSALLYTPSYAADLLQIYRDALVNDPTFSAARAQYLADLEKLPQGRAGLMPQITSGWNTNKNTGQTVQGRNSIPSTSYSQTGWNLSLSQPLFRWERWETYQQGKLAQINAEAELRQAHLELILRVTQAYFDLLAAQDNLELAKTKKHSIQEQLAQAKHHFELGTSTVVDIDDAQARFDLANAQEIIATSEIEIKRAALQQITGTAPASVVGLKRETFVLQPDTQQLNNWVTQAERDNPLVTQAQVATEFAQREKNKAISGHLPTVDLVANRTYTNQAGTPSSPFLLEQPGGTRTFSNQIGIQINLPLFTGGATQSKVRETYALLDKSQRNLEAAKRNATQHARTAFLGFNNGLSQIKALEMAEKSALSAYASNKLGFEVGARINIDVLNAQEQLTTTQRDLYKARYDALLANLKLKASANMLGEEDVAWLNSLLDQR